RTPSPPPSRFQYDRSVLGAPVPASPDANGVPQPARAAAPSAPSVPAPAARRNWRRLNPAAVGIAAARVGGAGPFIAGRPLSEGASRGPPRRPWTREPRGAAAG